MKHDAIAWFPDRRADHGLGHTDADLVVPVGEVSFMGDLIEEGGPPVFDDGDPMSWPGTLRSALGAAGSSHVPGHGDTMDRAGSLTQLAEIEAVAVLTHRCVEEGMPVPEAARLGPYPAQVMTSALNRALAVRL